MAGRSSSGRRCRTALDGGGTETVQEWDNADYCVAGPITDHRDGTLTVKMGKYTQLEEALRQIGEALA
ncbi:MAG: hypothetical protein ACLUFI_05335 [Oscillospiraceae bacterium]